MIQSIFGILGLLLVHGALFRAQPSVVLVITDDQGYGDLGCTGNPVIKTPHTDKLANESIWLTDYPRGTHLLSAYAGGFDVGSLDQSHGGVYDYGAVDVAGQRGYSGQFFKDNGYETGMFGKWHLGDNFRIVRRIVDLPKCTAMEAEVGQTPDVWDNAYFDGGYFHNGKIVKAKGFCTVVFFEQGNQFITESVKRKKPFCIHFHQRPHGPFHCPQKVS